MQDLPDLTVELVENPQYADIDSIFSLIRAYNDTRVDVWQPYRLGIFARDSHSQMLGGIHIVLARGWMYLDCIAVAETMRHHGLGSRLLTMAESEARTRQCHRAWLETYSFQAPAFYERHGYRIFGALDDYPVGHQRYFMQKVLVGVVQSAAE
jgi:ribosomal protein S18 acetylase RimI-like enzyme